MPKATIKAPIGKMAARAIQDALDHWEKNAKGYRLKSIKVGTKTVKGVRRPCLDILIEK